MAFKLPDTSNETGSRMGTINYTWWNLQNFFDTDDDPISSDFAFTVAEGWTPAVFAAKKMNLAEALKTTHSGAGPELLAVCEIEKDSLLEDLIAEMGLSAHLRVVKDPSDTKDLRGIDVAMAFDRRKLKKESVTSHLIHLRYRTRDILEVNFEVTDTGEKLTVIAAHWPSRTRGKYRTDPLRCAAAEHIAYLVEDHCKIDSQEYLSLRNQNDLQPIRDKWEAKVMLVGDLNDEPCDRSLVDHLRASNDLDRVIGRTNDIDRFQKEVSRYRAQEVFLYNATWKFLPQPLTGTYFIDGTRSGEKFPNRYQVLDQLIATRGLVSGNGLTLDIDSVEVFKDSRVATSSGRPRGFSKSSQNGTSDHLPVNAVLTY